jgi:hypothetical protein
MEKKNEGLLEILNGEGAASDNKIIKYATYATSAVLIAAVGYAVYKSIKNSKEIENLQSQLAEIKGANLTAPETETVTI